MEPKCIALSERLNALASLPKCAFGISSPPFESAPAPDHRVAHSSPYCRCGIDTVVMRDFSLRSRDWVPRRLNSGTGLGCVVIGWAASRDEA